MLPRSFEADFDELWARLGQGLRGWVGGTVIAMFLMGSVTAVGLFFAGIQGWALLGLPDLPRDVRAVRRARCPARCRAC